MEALRTVLQPVTNTAGAYLIEQMSEAKCVALAACRRAWADSEKVGGTGHDSITKYAHDAHGRLTQTTDPSGHVTSIAYYTTGFQNTETVTAVNRVTAYRYDRYGRADSTTMPGGAIFTLSLDSLNRTRASRGPNGVHATYAYDSLSHMSSITDAKGQTYHYSYNPVGWLITQINADTNHTLSARTDSFFYSAAGLVTKHRDRNAMATSMTYDSLGRTVTLTLGDGRVTKYGYDPNGLFQADSNAASIDTSKTDATGLTYTEFTKQAGQSYTVTSTVDANGLLRSTVLKKGATTWDSLYYNYDFDLRLSELSTTTGGVANTIFHYAADGLLTSWKLPTTGSDSVLVGYSQTHQPISLSYNRAALDTLDELLGRDTLDRVVQQSVGPLGSMNDTVRFFAYDSTGRLTTYADSLSADSLICVPDPHGQDGEHCTPSGGWTFVAQSSYTYDSANNRTDLGAVLTPGNRATTFNGYTLTYDNVGDLTHKSKTGFDQYYYWNSIDQLDSVVTNGANVSFDYDGRGRRVSKRAGFDLRYIYAGSQLIAEVDSSITTIAQKVYRYYPGVDNPHSVKEVSGTYYYLSGIGTSGVVAVIDSTGKIKNRYRYNPWGGLEDSLETVTNVVKFAGREYDPETHLYYNRARYYDPQLARFLSEDPIGQSGGVNQYAYAANNPVTNTDPSGECVPAGQHDTFHTCGAPEADGTPGRGTGGSSPTQAWHCSIGPEVTCVPDPTEAAMYDDLAADYADAGWGPEDPIECLIGFALAGHCKWFSSMLDAIGRLEGSNDPACAWYGWDANRRLSIGAIDYTPVQVNAKGQPIRGEYDASDPGNGMIWLTRRAFDPGWDPLNTIAHEESHYAGYPDAPGADADYVTDPSWPWGTAADQGQMCQHSS